MGPSLRVSAAGRSGHHVGHSRFVWPVPGTLCPAAFAAADVAQLLAGAGGADAAGDRAAGPVSRLFCLAGAGLAAATGVHLLPGRGAWAFDVDVRVAGNLRRAAAIPPSGLAPGAAHAAVCRSEPGTAAFLASRSRGRAGWIRRRGGRLYGLGALVAPQHVERSACRLLASACLPTLAADDAVCPLGLADQLAGQPVPGDGPLHAVAPGPPGARTGPGPSGKLPRRLGAAAGGDYRGRGGPLGAGAAPEPQLGVGPPRPRAPHVAAVRASGGLGPLPGPTGHPGAARPDVRLVPARQIPAGGRRSGLDFGAGRLGCVGPAGGLLSLVRRTGPMGNCRRGRGLAAQRNAQRPADSPLATPRGRGSHHRGPSGAAAGHAGRGRPARVAHAPPGTRAAVCSRGVAAWPLGSGRRDAAVGC